MNSFIVASLAKRTLRAGVQRVLVFSQPTMMARAVASAGVPRHPRLWFSSVADSDVLLDQYKANDSDKVTEQGAQ